MLVVSLSRGQLSVGIPRRKSYASILRQAQDEYIAVYDFVLGDAELLPSFLIDTARTHRYNDICNTSDCAAGWACIVWHAPASMLFEGKWGMSGGYRRYLAVVLVIFLNLWGAYAAYPISRLRPERGPVTSARSGYSLQANFGAGPFSDFVAEHASDYLTVFYDGRSLTSPLTREVDPASKSVVGGTGVLARAGREASPIGAAGLRLVFEVITTRD